jgi:hypothetical protein
MRRLSGAARRFDQFHDRAESAEAAAREKRQSQTFEA